MDFSEELTNYKIKTNDAAPSTESGATSVDFPAAARFLEQNPESFTQTLFADGTSTSIALSPEYQAYRLKGETPPATAFKYKIQTSYHKDGGSIAGERPYSSAIVHGKFNDPANPEITFTSLQLSGYTAAPSLAVTVTGPQDYSLLVRERGLSLRHTAQEAFTAAVVAKEHLRIAPLPENLAQFPVLDFTRAEGASQQEATLDGKPAELAATAACAKWLTKGLVIDNVTDLPSGPTTCPWEKKTEQTFQQLK